jgi:hypothetical protein
MAYGAADLRKPLAYRHGDEKTALTRADIRGEFLSSCLNAHSPALLP